MKVYQFYIHPQRNEKEMLVSSHLHQHRVALNFFDLCQSGVSLEFCFLSNELPILLLLLIDSFPQCSLTIPRDLLRLHPPPLAAWLGGESPLGFG